MTTDLAENVPPLTDTDRAPRGRRAVIRALRSRRPAFQRWVVGFIGFFLLGAGWAFAAPYDGSPDEAQHILRAAGVARGEFVPQMTTATPVSGQYLPNSGTGAYQTVAKGLLVKNCWSFHTSMSAACAKEPGGDNTLVKSPTRAGLYNPTYYLAVGFPLRWWPNWTGVYLARLISAAMVAAFLACAVYAASFWTRYRFMLAGVVTAVTPITLHLAGSVNPNGPEIAAGVALFSVLIPYFLDKEAKLPSKAALAIATVSGSALLVLRSAGPLWFAVVLGSLVLPTTRKKLKELWQSKAVRISALVLTLVGLFGVAWTILLKVNKAGAVGGVPNVTAWQGVEFEFMVRWGWYITEFIGNLSWLDAKAPDQFYTTWYIVLGALLFTAAAFASWSDRWRMFLLAAFTFGFPTVSDALGAGTFGFIAQGRYMLPVAVGLPIMAAYLLAKRGVFTSPQAGTMLRACAVVVLPLQMAFLWFTMIRWQSGQSTSLRHVRINALAGTWHPPVGSVVPLLTALAGCVVIGALCWRIGGQMRQAAAVETPPDTEAVSAGV